MVGSQPRKQLGVGLACSCEPGKVSVTVRSSSSRTQADLRARRCTWLSAIFLHKAPGEVSASVPSEQIGNQSLEG